MVTSARASTAAAIATPTNEDVGRAIELGEMAIATATTAQGIAEAIWDLFQAANSVAPVAVVAPVEDPDEDPEEDPEEDPDEIMDSGDESGLSSNDDAP